MKSETKPGTTCRITLHLCSDREHIKSENIHCWQKKTKCELCEKVCKTIDFENHLKSKKHRRKNQEQQV